MRAFLLLVAIQALNAQVEPVVSKRNLTDQVQVVRVAPRFATAIGSLCVASRLPKMARLLRR